MADQRAQRRLAAIVVADVVGYSRLMESDEVGTLAALRERRASVLQPLVTQHHGRIVKVMGDGVLIEFSSAVNAVACAVDLQLGMGAANEGLAEDRRVVLRIGVNLGDVLVEGGDLYGDGVNIAARLQGLAPGGETWVSAEIFRQANGKGPYVFRDLGERTLKNIATPVHVYDVISASTGSGCAVPAWSSLTLPDKPSIAVLPFENLSGDRSHGGSDHGPATR
jgi:class 3 adenylate cyclase